MVGGNWREPPPGRLRRLLAAGYSGREVANLVQHQNFTEFQDCGCWRRLPKIGPALSLIFRLGICLHQDLPERHGLVGREIDFKSILSGITCPGEQYGKAGYTEVGKEVVVFETVQGIRNQPVYKG